MTTFIGNDILDIGSRKADIRAKRQRGIGLPDDVLLGGSPPDTFDVPNVPDVSLNQRRVLFPKENY